MTEQTNTTEQAEPTKPRTPYQERHRKIAAVVAEWQAQASNPGWDPADAVSSLVDLLYDRDLQILPRVNSYGRWRVTVDDAPAPSPHAPDRPSGPLDADEAVDAFLLAVYADEATEAAGPHRQITIRPASDKELVADLLSDRSLSAPPMEITPEFVAVLVDEQDPTRQVLEISGEGHTVRLRLTPDTRQLLAGGLATEADDEDGL